MTEEQKIKVYESVLEHILGHKNCTLLYKPYDCLTAIYVSIEDAFRRTKHVVEEKTR